MVECWAKKKGGLTSPTLVDYSRSFLYRVPLEWRYTPTELSANGTAIQVENTGNRAYRIVQSIPTHNVQHHRQVS